MENTTVVETAPQNPTEAPKPETAITPEVPSQKDEMAHKFASLARKERLARTLGKSVKAKEMELAQREQQILERERLWEEEFKKSPLEAIKKRGFTYEDLTNAVLNDGRFSPETEIKEVKSEIERFRQEQELKEKKMLEMQQKQAAEAEAQAVETFKSNITDFIGANKDKYELTALYEAEDLVFQTVEEHYNRTLAAGKPKIMSIEEAVSLVEEYIEAELDRTASSSKKFQSKYQMMKAKEEEQKNRPHSSQTLSNDLTPTSSAPSMLSTKTENERIKRALAALG